MITLISPAKINLFLQILNRRPDGYHELASLFQTISLHDTLTFSFSEKDTFTCSDSEIPTDATNLVLKALFLFRLKTDLQKPLSIHLTKHIPKEAGLGGGSSNAATTLYALNQLFTEPLSLTELQILSEDLGSDVPFFFSEGTAYCRGRGEIVENLPPLEGQTLYIIKPEDGLKTPLIFKNLKPENLPSRNPETALKSFSTKTPHFYNDLEIPAFSTLPSLKDLKEKLLSIGFQTVLMSGSGSAFFCFGEPHSFNPEAFTFTHKAQFINREKKMWYKTENPLQ